MVDAHLDERMVRDKRENSSERGGGRETVSTMEEDTSATINNSSMGFANPGGVAEPSAEPSPAAAELGVEAVPAPTRAQQEKRL